jgi:hypothetical protein
MHEIAKAPRAGFETAIKVPSGYASFELQAVDAGGQTLGTSDAFAAAPAP